VVYFPASIPNRPVTTRRRGLSREGRDETCACREHPQTVFQILNALRRYNPEMVRTSGDQRENFDYLARSIVENSGREPTTCFGMPSGGPSNHWGPIHPHSTIFGSCWMGTWAGRRRIMALRGTPASRLH